jgi:hypothetical protein
MVTGSPQLLTSRDELNQFIQCSQGYNDCTFGRCDRGRRDRRGGTQPALVDVIVETRMMRICDDAAGVCSALAHFQDADPCPVHRMTGLAYILKP